MGVFDKIKNALFEVEYVEVDEPVKEKKPKKNEEDSSDEKPIAKKIVLPGKREEKIKKIQEEELIDQDFEVRPKDENIKEADNSSFKFMDDADFKVEDEPVIIRSIDEVEVLDDSINDVVVPSEEDTLKRDETVNAYRGVSPIQNDTRSLSTLNSSYRIKERESRPYGMDPSYRVSIKEYGVYDNKDDKSGFKPSPIISPIYGILDKNYKKEDVVSKKEVRITSNYTRKNMNVDDIRNKAYGKDDKEDKKNLSKDEKPVVEDNNDEGLLVDLSDEKEKPEVKELTVGDAMEYFQDLGLEYNVDYVDASNKNNKGKTEELEEVEEEKKEDVPVPAPVPVVEEDEKKETVKAENVSPVEVIQEDKEEVLDDDNLFDLIDSMYKDNN